MKKQQKLVEGWGKGATGVNYVSKIRAVQKYCRDLILLAGRILKPLEGMQLYPIFA